MVFDYCHQNVVFSPDALLLTLAKTIEFFFHLHCEYLGVIGQLVF
jgi:hypothetical protein